MPPSSFGLQEASLIFRRATHQAVWERSAGGTSCECLNPGGRQSLCAVNCNPILLARTRHISQCLPGFAPNTSECPPDDPGNTEIIRMCFCSLPWLLSLALGPSWCNRKVGPPSALFSTLIPGSAHCLA